MRQDLELQHRDLFEELLQLVGVLDGRHLDQQPVGAGLRDDGLGDAHAVDAPVDDQLDLILDLGRDFRHVLGRVELKQDASAALEVEAEVDLLLDRHDRPYAEADQGQQEDRLNRPLELIPHVPYY